MSHADANDAVYRELMGAEFVGKSEDGLVKVYGTCEHTLSLHIKNVEIDETLLNKKEKEKLNLLLVDAINECYIKFIDALKNALLDYGNKYTKSYPSSYTLPKVKMSGNN